jgi:TolB protein
MTTLALLATAIAGPPIASAEPDNSPTMAAHGVEAPLGTVPWSRVGPGWMLGMWSPNPANELTATTTLYLVDPVGGRYAITTFPPLGDGSSPPLIDTSPKLVDWSNDGTRALFAAEQDSKTVITQVDLRSGTKTTFSVDHVGAAPRYTRPNGEAVLLTSRFESSWLERVDLAGNHQLTYPVGPHFYGYLSTPDGTRLVLDTGSGLILMGNDGVVGKALPVAGQSMCEPMRWWDTGSTIAVARCFSSSASSSARQLWLVPIDGTAPTALTAPNKGDNGPDYGDANAWQLPTGTYVQADGAGGVAFPAKLNGDGTTSPVSVPQVHSEYVAVVGVNEGHLELLELMGGALIDYNPAAGTSTVLLGPPVNGGGVISAVPYPGQN